MERVTGIEPVTEAWEAFVIPFHHTRITLSWDMLYPEDRQEGQKPRGQRRQEGVGPRWSEEEEAKEKLIISS